MRERERERERERDKERERDVCVYPKKREKGLTICKDPAV